MRAHYPARRTCPGRRARRRTTCGPAGCRGCGAWRSWSPRSSTGRTPPSIADGSARAVAGLGAPPVAGLGQGAAGPDRRADPGRLAGVRGEPVRPALDRVPRSGELVLRLLGLGRRAAAWTGTAPCGSCGGSGCRCRGCCGAACSTSGRCARCGWTPRGRRATSCGPSKDSGGRSSRGGWPSGCGRGTCRPARTGCTPPSCRTGSARRAALWAVRSGADVRRAGPARPRWA